MSVAVVMGSASDAPVMEGAVEVLRDFDVPFEVRVLSAHRTPDDALDFARQAAAQGRRVLIAGAGGAAHLAGVLAAVTALPVIGVPIAVGELGGLDSLLAMVQMPKGVPVATVAVNGAGNAGLLAVRILALSDERLAGALARHRDEMATKVRAADEEIRTRSPDSRTARRRRAGGPNRSERRSMRIVVTGASGLIGRALSAPWAPAGHETVVLVRRPAGAGRGPVGPRGGQTSTPVRSTGAGRRRPSGRRRDRRPAMVAGPQGRHPAESGRTRPRCSVGPWPASTVLRAVLVSASAIGYYGDRGDEELTETSGAGDGVPGRGLPAPGKRRRRTPRGRGSGSSTCGRPWCSSRHGGALARQLPAVSGRSGRDGSGRGTSGSAGSRCPDEVGAILHVIGEQLSAGSRERVGPGPR